MQILRDDLFGQLRLDRTILAGRAGRPAIAVTGGAIGEASTALSAAGEGTGSGIAAAGARAAGGTGTIAGTRAITGTRAIVGVRTLAGARTIAGEGPAALGRTRATPIAIRIGGTPFPRGTAGTGGATGAAISPGRALPPLGAATISAPPVALART